MKYALAAALALGVTPAFAQESADALADAFVAAVVAEDADALASLYTEDADSYDPSGSVQKGRAEIAATWKQFFDAYDGFTASLDRKGHHAPDKKSHASWGLWTMSATPAGGGEPVTWNGRYLDVSVKTKDGWKYIVDHASMLAPQAPAADAAAETAKPDGE
ncbi:MAG: nuclear transport factor 2 family protein [Parvularculaceae bacterium]|nr:nuclear transport factor 2 family protein [Parvularculaceae bacterium]